jgi:hypothetical protein
MPSPTLQETHIDSALTNMSVAYLQDPNMYIADKVFPIVPVEKQSDRYFVYKKEDWLRDEAVERAAGTESAGGGYDIDNTPSYYCIKWAYHKDVTDDDRTNSDEPLRPDEDAVQFVTDKMLLRRENLWAQSYFKASVWGTDMTGAPSADQGAGTFIHWDDYENSNPIEDIDTQRWAIASVTGKLPQILVLGPYTYKALRNHPIVLDRIKYTQRGIVTPDLLATLLDVDKVLVAAAVQNASAKGAATQNINFVFGKGALLTYAAPSPGIKTASGGYCFAWNGLFGSGAYGNRIGRIPMPWLGEGTERIEGEMAFDIKVVGADLGCFFAGCVS